MAESNSHKNARFPFKGLRVRNSLCVSKDSARDDKELFVPSSSNLVKWYICGPTVYDSSHVGHARNYMTFDILRRILEGYFNYRVLFVMNVTDVDDKIINKARRNYLLKQYLESATEAKKVLEDLKIAFEKETSNQKRKTDLAIKELEEATTSRRKDELTEKVKQENLKLQKIEELSAQLKLNENKALDSGGKSGIDMLTSGGVSDVLASYLDSIEGATVTDVAIYRAHAAKYEKEFLEDLESLGVKPPVVLTRVTEYIDEIIMYVQRIIEKGLAYAMNGSVYFDTKAFQEAGHIYGKLNPWAVGSSELASESESNFDNKEKKNSCDFALWKKSKSGEPYWDSPWGNGRPGWHIECSAMASKVIGEMIDIHSGGVDLRFPHHDNELAQAEAYFGCSEWVKYFIHSGHLAIEGLKMSKSLKNFVTIREALRKYTARQLRFLFVNQSWDKPMNYGEAVMSEALSKEKQLLNFFKVVKSFLRDMKAEGGMYAESFNHIQCWGEEEKELSDALADTIDEVRDHLEDNFDTPAALQSLLNLTSRVLSYMGKKDRGNLLPMLVKEAAIYVTQILVTFGLSTANVTNEIGFGSESEIGTSTMEEIKAPYITAACSLRDEVRVAAKENPSKEKLISITDSFRDYTMVDLGVRVEDSASGTIWDFGDPAFLRKERDEKLQKINEARIKTLESKIERKIKDIEKLELASADPKEFFQKQTSKYSAFSDSGLPTHDCEGKELSKKAAKDAEKLLQKMVKEHEKYKERISADPLFLEKLKSEVKDLSKQLDELKVTT